MALPAPNPAEGSPSWFTDEFERSDAAAADIKRALPAALNAAQDARIPAPVELFDPIRHHGLEQRELIQIQAGGTLDRALWPGLFLGSTIAAIVGWILLIRSGTPRHLWSPILSQLVAVVCGQLWAFRLRERFPIEVMGLSAVSWGIGDRRSIRAFLRTSSAIWCFMRTSAERQPVAEGILFYGAHAAALLGALGWSASLQHLGTAALPWSAKLGYASIEGALVLWLGFLIAAIRALDRAEHALSTSSTTPLGEDSRGAWWASSLWIMCGAILALAFIVSAIRVGDKGTTLRLSMEKGFAAEEPSEAFTHGPLNLKVAQSLRTKPLSIYFGSGSAELGPGAKQTMDSAASTLQTLQDA